MERTELSPQAVAAAEGPARAALVQNAVLSRAAALLQSAVDQARIRRAVREILIAIGEDPDREGLADTPARVAAFLRDRGWGGSAVTVLEALGAANERCVRGVAAQWNAEPCGDLNTIAVDCVADAGTRVIGRTPGLPDDAFAHDGQLTKREVRAATAEVVDDGNTQCAPFDRIRAGADLVELGVPYSDPLADGATLQRASHAALLAGATFDRSLALVARIAAARPGAAMTLTAGWPAAPAAPEFCPHATSRPASRIGQAKPEAITSQPAISGPITLPTIRMVNRMPSWTSLTCNDWERYRGT